MNAEWMKKYMAPLVGGTIIEAGAKDEDGIWPYFKVKLKNGQEIECEVSGDEEGNHGGFLFGLPFPEVKSNRSTVGGAG